MSYWFAGKSGRMRRSLACTGKHRSLHLLCCRGSAMSAAIEEFLGKIRAAALARGEDWLREKVAEILKDEAKASDAQDLPPCASRVRPHERRSPSPVPRTQPRLWSPSSNPPGSASWQCPASVVMSPGRNPFHLDTDLRDLTDAGHCHDEDLRPLLDTTSQYGANSGPSTTVAVTVSVEDDGLSDDDSGQHYVSLSKHSQPDMELASSTVTAEESDAARIERVLQSCSAAANLGRRCEPTRSMPVSPSAPDCQPCLVWILGDSFVTSAMKRLSLLPDGCQLGFSRSKVIIRWLGTDGITWDCVRPTAARQALLDRPPDILVVHAGADDLGIIPIRELIEIIKFDMLRLQALFSEAIIVWSDIVNRHKWPQAQSKNGIGRARIKVNHNASKFLTKKGVVVIHHRGLEDGSPHLFEENGISLNSAGTDIWLIDIQEGIDKALQLWKNSHATTPSHTV
ncbi:uncharacterized protein LOC130291486 [Hyla sarda]|uniref:uncharacterized protein LOC130291486 n=1 Tax=Hyla sarda TaxID=327740 RepID=UPI0024C26FEB|nr:uncharacterized protein LOC130291486 [Hyla sarda]